MKFLSALAILFVLLLPFSLKGQNSDNLIFVRILDLNRWSPSNPLVISLMKDGVHYKTGYFKKYEDIAFPNLPNGLYSINIKIENCLDSVNCQTQLKDGSVFELRLSICYRQEPKICDQKVLEYPKLLRYDETRQSIYSSDLLRFRNW